MHHGWLRAALSLVLLMVGPARGEEPPATGGAVGTISGTVLDRTSGDPIIEAGVEVIGQKRATRTDLDGRFALKLAPGTYEVRYFAPGYMGARVTKVIVTAGGVTRADAVLGPAGAAGVDVVEVVAQAKKANEGSQLLKRQKAATVSDNISAETIQKSPDSDAAEVVERVPAVTIKNDRFVFVRGLGERYSSALLNGSRLPSTDPNKRVVPLDLFPADFLDSISIMKSFTPNLPGDFSGGLVDIDLRDFPDQLSGGWGTSTSFNTASTAKRFLTYRGGKNDAFGFGAAGRDLPSRFPDSNIQIPSPSLQRGYAGILPDIWDVDTKTAPPNTGVNFNLGNSLGNFGFNLGGNFSNAYQTRANSIARRYTNAGTFDDPQIQVFDSYRTDISTYETKLGAILTSAYRLNDDHKLTFRSLLDRNSGDQTLAEKGTNTQGNPTEISQLKYTAEELAFGQIGGEDHWGWIDSSWRSAYSLSTQDIPDTRNLTYSGAPPAFINDAAGGQRVYANLHETLTDSGLDFTVPFRTRLPFTEFWQGLAAKFQFGAAYAYRERNYDQRTFKYTVNDQTFASLPPEELLADQNIGAPGRPVQFSETTQNRDQFHATEEIIGGYGMFDVPLVRDQLRLIAGCRFEYSNIRLNTANDQNDPLAVHKLNTNPLPSVGLVYTPRSDMNIRASWSQTVSRPEFRELTPALFPEPGGFTPTIGNPALVQSDITNWDVRYEWFFAPQQLISIGGFYKSLTAPIELVVIPGASDLRNSFQNADSATVKGVEFELRRSLGMFSPVLENLYFTTNLAYIDSTVSQPRAEKLQVQTSTERQLQGQSPFVVNAAVEYTHPRWGTVRALYNTAGRSIDAVGANGLPDLFQERVDELDAVLIVPLKEIHVPANLKLAAENLLNDQHVVTQAGATSYRWLTGTTFSIGVSFSF